MRVTLIRAALVAAFLLILVAALLAVRGHEVTLAEGRIVLFELAPVDPRSMMQGDYMALAYAIDQQLAEQVSGTRSDRPEPEPAYAYLQLDPDGRAYLAGTGAEPPVADSGLVAIRLRSRYGMPTIGPNAFFFHEGTAERYEAARWGEFRVAPDGSALLTHLRDADLQRLGEIER